MAQPTSRIPRRPQKHEKIRARHLLRSQGGQGLRDEGVLDYENRAATFDFQNRWIPLDFEANDVSLLMSYMPAARQACRRDTTSRLAQRDLNLSRGKAKPMNGTMRAMLDLSRNSAYLRSLRITSRAAATTLRTKSHTTEDHTVRILRHLQDFTHPHWQARRRANSIWAPRPGLRLSLYARRHRAPRSGCCGPGRRISHRWRRSHR